MNQTAKPLPPLLLDLKKEITPFVLSIFQEIDKQMDNFGFDNGEGEELKKAEYSVETITEYKNKLFNLKGGCSVGLDDAFDRLVALEEERREFDEDDEFSHLSLVDDEALDLHIMVGQFERSVRDAYVLPLTQLVMRFEKVMREEYEINHIPLSPQSIGNVIADVIDTLEVPSEEKKLVLVALLNELAAEFVAFLKVANGELSSKGILPHITEEDAQNRINARNIKKEAKKKREELLESISDPENSDGSVRSDIANLFQNIDVDKIAAGHMIQSNPNGPEITQDQLIEKVEMIKPIVQQAEEGSIYLKPTNKEESLAEKLESEGGISEFGVDVQSSSTISMMSMLFDELLQNEAIADPIKAILEQLQVPLLKAAIQDEKFFGDADNPAQQLFNDLAQAGSSWAPHEKQDHDLLYKKMSNIVEQVNDDYQDDYLAFDSAIADFTEFSAKEKRKTAAIEQRVIQAEEVQARAAIARQVSTEHIDETFGRYQLPEELTSFFNDSWKHVLFFNRNKHEEAGDEAWSDAVEVEQKMLNLFLGNQEASSDEIIDSLKTQMTDAGVQGFDINAQIDKITPFLKPLTAEQLQPAPITSAKPKKKRQKVERKRVKRKKSWHQTVDAHQPESQADLEAARLLAEELGEDFDLDDAVNDTAPEANEDLAAVASTELGGKADEPLSFADASDETTDDDLLFDDDTDIDWDNIQDDESEVYVEAAAAPEYEFSDEETDEDLETARMLLEEASAEDDDEFEFSDEFIEIDEDDDGDLDELCGDLEDMVPERDEFDEIVEQVTIGTWFKKGDDDEDFVKIKVAAYIKHTDTFVLVHRNGKKYDSLNSQQLAAELRSGEFNIVEGALVFDRALESVIGKLME